MVVRRLRSRGIFTPGIWTSPEYPFRVPVPNGGGNLQEIVIDVTLSAPPFPKPSAPLKEILDECVSTYLPKGGQVLDFGAGRLRNALYLLEQDVKVCGVEFEKLVSSEKAAKRYRKAKRLAGFWSLAYPDEFLRDASRFDLVLLINVLNIMPREAERSLVLQECFKRLNPGGHVLWYTQYGDPYYENQCKDENRVGDGWYLGAGHKFKTFYTEFSAGEIDSLMAANGFEFIKSYTVPRNRVRLYKRGLQNPFRQIISKTELRRAFPLDTTILPPAKTKPRIVPRSAGMPLVQPNPEALSHETKLLAALHSTPPGKANAGNYRKVVEAILARALVPSRLERLTGEQPIFDGRQRIDIHGVTGKEGFFANLNDRHNIVAPYVTIECKNKSDDPGNREFAQLQQRLDPEKGQFGILVCRKIDDRQAMLDHCKDAREKHDYIIVVTDEDLEKLLQFALDEDLGAVDELFASKLREVLLR